jgi:hypothetical protein
MKKLAKIVLTTIILIIIIFLGTKTYLKYCVKKIVTENTINDLIDKINSAPTLPKSFKNIYSKVYPGIFKKNFTANTISIIFNQTSEQCPSRQVANNCLALLPNTKSIFDQRLNYVGFIWLLEDHISQEKCFEYLMSHWDFLNNTKGPNEAAIYYYKKTLDSLTLEEQLGIILKIQNPSLYDNTRRLEKYEEAVKKLKAKIVNS